MLALVKGGCPGRHGNVSGTVAAYRDAMNDQQAHSKLKMRNKIFVAWPTAIATLCLGLVVPGVVSPLIGVVLGLAMVLLLWLGGILGQVLADRSAAQRDQ